MFEELDSYIVSIKEQENISKEPYLCRCGENIYTVKREGCSVLVKCLACEASTRWGYKLFKKVFLMESINEESN